MTLDPLHTFTHALPKVELHCHLLGTVRRETLAALSERQGWPVSEEEIAGYYTRSGKPAGAIRVLRALDAVLIKQPDDLYRHRHRAPVGHCLPAGAGRHSPGHCRRPERPRHHGPDGGRH